MRTCTQMTSRRLSVKESVYKKLLEAKKGNESFNDVIERFLDGGHDLMAFAGIHSGTRSLSE